MCQMPLNALENTKARKGDRNEVSMPFEKKRSRSLHLEMTFFSIGLCEW